MNFVPAPGSLVHEMVPWWFSTIIFAMESPSPVPGIFVVPMELLRKNLENIWLTSDSLMPIPWSSTSSWMHPSVLEARTVTVPPSGEYLIAFDIRLSSTCPILNGSTLAGRLSGTSWTRVIPAFCAGADIEVTLVPIIAATSAGRGRTAGEPEAVSRISETSVSNRSALLPPTWRYSLAWGDISFSSSRTRSRWPRIDVSGVCSSWASVEMKSSLAFRALTRSVTSVRTMTDPPARSLSGSLKVRAVAVTARRSSSPPTHSR